MAGDSEEWARTVRKTCRAFTRWFFRLIIMPTLGLITVFFVWQYQNAKMIKLIEDRIVTDGEPLSPKDLARMLPEVPPDRNAAIPLMELWAQSDPEFWKAFREGRPGVQKSKEDRSPRDIPIVGAGMRRGEEYRLPWAETNRLAAVKYLGEKEGYLKELREALALPNCRFPVRFEDGMLTQVSHLSELKEDAGLLLLSAFNLLETGDTAGAIDELNVMARIGKHLDDEPATISQLVRLNCQQMTIMGGVAVCGYGDVSADDLGSLSRLLEELRLDDGALKQALVSERASVLPMMRYGSEYLHQTQGVDEGTSAWSGFGVRTVVALFKLTGMPKDDHRFALESFDQIIEISGLDLPERVSKATVWKNEVERASRRFPLKILSGLYLSSLDRVVIRSAEYEALRGAAAMAVEIERYRLDHGGVVERKLTDMVSPGILETYFDPFNGEPMRLRLLDNSYVIYSVGPDLEDNLGDLKMKSSRSKDRNYDVGVEIDHRRRE